MSSDTSYKITIKGANDQINAVIVYLDQKLLRWEDWKNLHNSDDPKKRQKAFKNTLKSFGFTKPSEFVSWGLVKKN